VRTISGFAARLATLVLLALHFLLTLIYVLPVTPVKMALGPIVFETIGTYFAQNWSFFAPNPVASNSSLLVCPLRPDEIADARRGQVPADRWYDLTAPVWNKFHHHRLSAYDRLARPQSNGIRMYLGNTPELIPWIDACSNGDPVACVSYQKWRLESQRSASDLLSKVASAFCNERFRAGQFTGVALRIRQQTAPPWSARYTGAPITKDLDIGVFAVDRKIEPLGLYGESK